MHHPGLVEFDGDVDATDNTAWTATQGGGGVYNRHLDADLDGDNDTTMDKVAFDVNYLAPGDSVEVSGRAWSPSGVWFGYTARQLDPETGLLHYRARAYAPFLHQFAQRDPIGYLDSASLYQYVAGNPLGFLDPHGLGKIEYVYVNPTGVNRFGHSAIKHTDDNGKVTYIDASQPTNKDNKATVHRYTEEQFDSRYGERGWKSVGVFADPALTDKIIGDLKDGKKYPYNFISSNCTHFACNVIAQSGGQVPPGFFLISVVGVPGPNGRIIYITYIIFIITPGGAYDYYDSLDNTNDNTNDNFDPDWYKKWLKNPDNINDMCNSNTSGP